MLPKLVKQRGLGLIHIAGLVAAMFVLSACSPMQTNLNCQDGERIAAVESLYFGTAQPQGTVSPQQWQMFVNEVVTPRFPDGLTSWAASGQWRSTDGRVQREASHVLHIVHADSASSNSAVRELMQQYKSRFQQEAVLRVRSSACVSI